MPTDPVLRDERAADVAPLARLVAAAFDGRPYSDGTETAILDGLRRAGALTLSLVAEAPEGLVGQIAASPVTLGGASGWAGIGPVAVAPDRQRQGIGSALVRAALDRLRPGHAGVVLVGDPGYYGRFGFRPWPGLTTPGIPDVNVMALSFGDAVPAGAIRFHPAFGTLDR